MEQSQDILSYVRDGLLAHRSDPGWIHIAAVAGVNYSTIWRIVHEKKRDPKMSTIAPLADWLRANKRRRP